MNILFTWEESGKALFSWLSNQKDSQSTLVVEGPRYCGKNLLARNWTRALYDFDDTYPVLIDGRSIRDRQDVNQRLKTLYESLNDQDKKKIKSFVVLIEHADLHIHSKRFKRLSEKDAKKLTDEVRYDLIVFNEQPIPVHIIQFAEERNSIFIPVINEKYILPDYISLQLFDVPDMLDDIKNRIEIDIARYSPVLRSLFQYLWGVRLWYDLYAPVLAKRILSIERSKESKTLTFNYVNELEVMLLFFNDREWIIREVVDSLPSGQYEVLEYFSHFWGEFTVEKHDLALGLSKGSLRGNVSGLKDKGFLRKQSKYRRRSPSMVQPLIRRWFQHQRREIGRLTNTDTASRKTHTYSSAIPPKHLSIPQLRASMNDIHEAINAKDFEQAIELIKDVREGMSRREHGYITLGYYLALSYWELHRFQEARDIATVTIEECQDYGIYDDFLRLLTLIGKVDHEEKPDFAAEIWSFVDVMAEEMDVKWSHAFEARTALAYHHIDREHYSQAILLIRRAAKDVASKKQKQFNPYQKKLLQVIITLCTATTEYDKELHELRKDIEAGLND